MKQIIISKFRAIIFTLVGVSLLLSTSCHIKESRKNTLRLEAENRFTFDDFSKIYTLKSKLIHRTGLLVKAYDIHLIKNQFVLYNGIKDSYRCHLLDPETGEVFHFGKDGSESGQLLSLSNADYVAQSGAIWVHDVSRNIWNSYKLETILSNDSSLTPFLKSISFETNGLYHPFWVSKDTVIHALLSNGRGRLFFSNSSGNFLNAIGDIPLQKKRSLRGRVQAQAYQGNMTITPDRKLVFFAPRYADRLGIYTTKGEEYYKMRGPKEFTPIGTVMDFGGSKSFAAIPKTRHVYSDVAASNDYFYCLYSGKTEEMAPKEEDNVAWWVSFSDQVLIFKRDGTPFCQIKLDRPILDIAVDTSDTYLYGLDYETQEIVKYELPKFQ